MKQLFLILSFAGFLLLNIVDGFAIKPVKEYQQTPETFEINYTQRKIKVDSLITLNSWHLQPVINKKHITILISYGDFGNMSYSLLQAATLYDLGYDVVLYDYRGFGGSSAFEVNKDMLFDSSYVDDLTAVYNAYKKILPRQKMVFMAMSMGTIVTTTFLAEQALKDQLFVFDGFVASIDQTLKYLNGKKKVLSPFDDEVYQSYVENLKLNKGLIFNGLQDKVCVLTEEVKSAFQIVDYEGGHLQGFYKLTDGELTGNIYNKYIQDFIKGISSK